MTMTEYTVSRFRWRDGKQVPLGKPFKAHFAYLSWAQENVWEFGNDWCWKNELMVIEDGADELAMRACIELIRGDGTEDSRQRAIDLAIKAIAKAEGK